MIDRRILPLVGLVATAALLLVQIRLSMAASASHGLAFDDRQSVTQKEVGEFSARGARMDGSYGPTVRRQNRTDQDPSYAQIVAADGYTHAFGVEAPYDNPDNALGPGDVPSPNPNGLGFVSLGHAADLPEGTPDQPGFNPREGCEGFLILEWKTARIVDGPGVDITVYEAGTNSGSVGIAEAIHVLAGAEDGGWLYLGDFGTVTSFDIDPIDEDPTRYKYIALCDKVDRQAGPPTGGPDIDAVAALNWQEGDEPALEVKSVGIGNRVNDLLKEDGDRVFIGSGARLEIADEMEVDWCGNLTTSVLFKQIIIDDEPDLGFVKPILLDHFLENCVDATAASANSTTLTWQVTEGSLSIVVQNASLGLIMTTETASVSTVGEERYDLSFNPDNNETIIVARGGPLSVTPVNPNLPPFVLLQGQTAHVTADAVVAEKIFLPVVFGN